MSLQELSKQELIRLIEFLSQQLDIGVHVVDKKGKTILYNGKMAAIEEMKPAEILGYDIKKKFQFKDYSTLIEALEERQKKKSVQQTYFNSYGKEINTSNYTFPVKMEGKVIAAVELSKDMTRFERLIEEKRKKFTAFTFDQIIGTSLPIKEVIQDSKRATRTSSSVLIAGETGTGKELFAQSLHTGSNRSGRPFISQNCAAIPEHLMESILFGTKSGAFTGAKEREGLFEQAGGGTLLLDEINSLPPSLQAKLLRVLQEKKVRRLGDSKERNVDVRIIATINEDPVEEIAAGRLRKDLYYRLGVVSLIIPPLRERKEDIYALTAYFLKKFNKLFQMQVKICSKEVMNIFLNYDWPGNVRELEHIIEGAMNLMEDDETLLCFAHLPAHFRPLRRKKKLQSLRFHVSSRNNEENTALDKKALKPLDCVLKEKEREYIIHALTRFKGNVSHTAAAIGTSRQSLQYRMKKLCITKDAVWKE
ncbi:sigma-54 interaction domain-containing protein [Alteribacillus sp. JSM 102045]|uniref:sigma-54 interaction domain-containing protein n=1 Tax=Alteribacillus sp. JSM 102045 TaxID=1562101 RepID=UPI0035C16F1F